MDEMINSQRATISSLPRKIRRFTVGKVLCMEEQRSIHEIPQRCWRDRVTLDTAMKFEELGTEGTFLELLGMARRTLTSPRVRTDWCLQRGNIEYLGGEVAMAAESILQQQQYGEEFHENVQFFLPGALGWELPRSGVVSEYDLYQQSAWGMIQVLELRQFEYLESLQLFDKGDIDEYELEELFSPDDEEVEMTRVLLKVRNRCKEDRVVFLEQGTILEPRLSTTSRALQTTCLVVARAVRFLLPADMTRSKVVCCFCLRPDLQPPRGELSLTPFFFDLNEEEVAMHDSPYSDHLFLWRFLGEKKQRRETSHKALKLASRTAHNIFKKKLMEVVEVLGRSNQSGDLPPVLAKSYQDNWKKIVNSMSWCWPWCSGDPWSKMLKDKNSRSYGTAGGGEGEDSGEKKFICHERISLIVPVRGIPGSGFQFVNRLNLTLENVSQVHQGKYAKDFIDAVPTPVQQKDQRKQSRKIFSSLRSKAALRSVTGKDLGLIIESFEQHNKSFPFLHPVTKKEAPDYHQVIKQPMSLSVIKARYKNHEYDGKKGMKKFLKDFELIFSNAFSYNQNSSFVYKLAEDLEGFTVDRIQNVLQTLPVDNNATTAKRISNYVSHTLMDESGEEEEEEIGYSSASQTKQDDADKRIASQVLVPNILVTGTPGTGKSTLCSLLAKAFPSLQHIQISKVAVEQQLHAGKDETFDCHILDSAAEEKILDYLEPRVASGGCLVEHHSSSWFPERFFDLVVVLTCENGILYKRLKARGYDENKITENVECEIMQTVLQEAHDSYKSEKIKTFRSETEEQLKHAQATVSDFIQEWSQLNTAPEIERRNPRQQVSQIEIDSEQRPTLSRQASSAPPSPSLRGTKPKATDQKQPEGARSQTKQRRGGADLDLKENWTALTSAAIEHMMDIWKDIHGNPHAIPFEFPVTKKQAQDYKDVIRRPMALSNVRRKLENAQYNTLVEFFADMDVIFRNAMLYNREDSDIAIAARQLQGVLHRHCRRILPQTADKLLAEITPKSPAEDLVPTAAALHVRATKTPTDPMLLG